MRVSARRFAAMLVAASMTAASLEARAQSAQFASVNIWAHVQTTLQLNDNSTDTWGNVLSPLGVNAFITAPDFDFDKRRPRGSVTTFGSGDAVWASAAKGSISETLGFAFDDAIGTASFWQGGNHTPLLPTGLSDWEYGFQASNDGAFIMNADMTYIPGTLGLLGLGGWRVVLFGGPEVLQLGGGYSFSGQPLGTWSFTGQLTAGSTYIVALQSSAGAGRSQTPGTFSASQSGVFDWEMTGQTPVVTTPEPASYALVLTGLLAIVGVMRRRTRA